jgi:signal transduction histidine kinase
MINLNRIIEEIETLLIAEANHSNIELIIVKDPKLQDLLLNDKEIKQLILNLTRNGMESMSAGGKLYIRTIQLADEALLEVQDTGHGIPQDKLDQLFEPFYTTKPSGTGLGLAVCLSIVERHQAKIEVKSQESIGTTFTIRFNVQDEASKNAS